MKHLHYSFPLTEGDDISRIVQEQRRLEIQYDEHLNYRDKLRDQGAPSTEIEGVTSNIKEIAGRLRKSTQVLAKNLRQNPGAAENIIKMQGERRHIQDLLSTMLDELSNESTFNSLVDDVRNTIAEKVKLNQTVRSEEEGRRKDYA